MKCIYPFFILLMICQATRAQNNAYYGHDMVMPLREESNTNSKCNIIQLAGGIVVKDCDDATSSYAISDHRGSTRTILDGNLANKVSCDYDAYGNISADVPDNLKEQCRYTKTYRWSNNNQLYFAPERVYSPTAKRFLSTDMEQYNFSPYLYANANPVTFLDIDGRVPKRYWDVYEPYTRLVDPSIEKLLGHPDPPQNLTFDEGSLRTLAKMQPGHAFVGAIHTPTGKIYLSPVARRATDGAFWSGDDFTETIEMAGRTYPQIVHMEDDVVAHLQLAYRIEKDVMSNPWANSDAYTVREFSENPAFPKVDYLGFGLRWEKEKNEITVTGRSRSLNSPKFYREFNVARSDVNLYDQIAKDLQQDIYSEMPELATMAKNDEYFEKFNEALEFRLINYNDGQYLGYQPYKINVAMLNLGEYGIAPPPFTETIEELLSRTTRISGDSPYATNIVIRRPLTSGLLNQSHHEVLMNSLKGLSPDYKPARGVVPFVEGYF